MRSGRPGARESFPGVLGADGGIDLSGEGSSPPSQARSVRPQADAWVADRDRRSLAPRGPTEEAMRTVQTEGARVDLRREIADRFALGDFAGALHGAELLLGEDPEDETAGRYARAARERLEMRYTTRIGSLDYLFNRTVPEARVKWLGLDPQAAFLLSLCDGQTTVAEVLEVCRMGRIEALRVFTELLDARAVERVA